MSLSREIYTALEKIVGAKNISDKEYILAGNRNRTPEYPFDYHSADAIIMPGSTEEVRDIIRICNQNDICFVTEVSGVSAALLKETTPSSIASTVFPSCRLSPP